MRRGFTIVELVITVTIIGILLTLAVVNMNASQINARDSERKADVEAIALSLESFFSNRPDTGSATPLSNTYIGTNRLSKPLIIADLNEIDPKVLNAPNYEDNGTQTSVIAATNTAQSTADIQPQPTISQYVYQPLTATGSLCTNAAVTVCRKFNIYYRLETTNAVQMVTSKNQ